jgi:hypothetical protein
VGSCTNVLQVREEFARDHPSNKTFIRSEKEDYDVGQPFK